jgi:hypothetical protein
MGAAGTQTAAVVAGSSTYSVDAETYDGTTWTETGDLNTGRSGSSGRGDSTGAFVVGGQEPAYSDKTELYNGTTWTEVADLATARADSATGGGNLVSAVIAGGNAPPHSALSEEWAIPGATKTFTAS